jgi:hypothetical protein
MYIYYGIAAVALLTEIIAAFCIQARQLEDLLLQSRNRSFSNSKLHKARKIMVRVIDYLLHSNTANSLLFILNEATPSCCSA